VLSPYRVLDLADDRGIFCGRVLGDLGAEVIKVEPPGGDAARRIGPFYRDDPGIENSLYWQLYAANKKSVLLDVELSAERAVFLKLVESTDFLIESFRPGYLDRLGLGYQALHRINPRLIYVSITPFGHSGPYRDFLATDLVGSALSGFAYLTGDADRPPLRVSVPQFWLLGGAAGAAGAMVAHAQRTNTGEGQHVDVSCQQALARTLSHAPQFWDMNQVILKRSGPFRPIGDGRALRVNYECADGYVNYIQPGGATGGRGMAALSSWMDEEGEGHPMLRETDFAAFGFGQWPNEVLDAMSETLGSFFKKRTKSYLSEQAIARRVLLFPVNDPADICSYAQLAARGFFRESEAPDGEAMTTLGPWIHSSERPLPLRRAPRLGEHTQAVLRSVGLEDDEIDQLLKRNLAI
jgi:benzylsuccinate CoA-transferase BbsE subunit